VVRRLDFATPEPFRLVLGLGAGFAITLITFEGFLRADRPSGERMARAWILTALALAYVPWINWRWHLLNGIQIPLAVLATQGLRRTLFLRILRRRRRMGGARTRRFFRFSPALGGAMAVVLIVCCLSAANLLLYYRDEVSHPAAPAYLPAPQVEAMEWMGRELPRDAVVFASYPTGNYVPRLSGQRVFLGEDKLTAEYDRRMSEVRDFFGDRQTDSWRAELLKRSGAGYLFFGPEERALGPYEPARAPFLRSVYERRGVRIYRVEEAGSLSAQAPVPPAPAEERR